MSTRAYDAEKTSGSNAIGQTASRAASIIDDGVHRGADAVANAAHQTADQVGKASDYVWQAGGRIRERAAGVADVAGQHPAYSWIALGLVAFGLGYFMRGSRSDTR